MINKNRIRELLEAYKNNQINRKDFDELHGYLLEEDYDGELDVYFKELLEDMEVDESLSLNSDKIYNRIIDHPKFAKENKSKTVSVPRRFLNRSWQIGVAAMLCLGIGLYLFQSPSPVNNKKQENREDMSIVKTQKDDDFNGPMLLLGDGTKINLDSVQNGFLSRQGNVQIVVRDDVLAYNKSPVMKGTRGTAPMNSIIIPKGKQYHFVLPDGTKVWLNAATTLTYPAQFDGERRVVTIDGEAYFDVVPDERHPFVVKSNLQELEVLGTSFNISSYDDDNYVKTTLVEGRVQIKGSATSGNLSSTILKPGQQSTIMQGKHDIYVQPVDIGESIAWRNGVFIFNNEEIKVAMKKISRWYNVDVEYEKGIEEKLIGGSIQRFDDINELMKSLQATGLLRYKMERGKIIIMN